MSQSNENLNLEKEKDEKFRRRATKAMAIIAIGTSLFTLAGCGQKTAAEILKEEQPGYTQDNSEEYKATLKAAEEAMQDEMAEIAMPKVKDLEVSSSLSAENAAKAYTELMEDMATDFFNDKVYNAYMAYKESYSGLGNSGWTEEYLEPYIEPYMIALLGKDYESNPSVATFAENFKNVKLMEISYYLMFRERGDATGYTYSFKSDGDIDSFKKTSGITYIKFGVIEKSGTEAADTGYFEVNTEIVKSPYSNQNVRIITEYLGNTKTTETK